MLERLIALLEEGGTYRVADLARALDTTPELVEMMLEDLARRGRIRPVDPTCPSSHAACADCPLASHCSVPLRFQTTG